MPDAIGIPEEMLREAAKSAVCKVNIDLITFSDDSKTSVSLLRTLCL